MLGHAIYRRGVGSREAEAVERGGRGVAVTEKGSTRLPGGPGSIGGGRGRTPSRGVVELVRLWTFLRAYCWVVCRPSYWTGAVGRLLV